MRTKVLLVLMVVMVLSAVAWGFRSVRPIADAAPPDRPGAESPKPAEVGSSGSRDQYSLEQAMSDNAQLSTIAFSGLAFITGNATADSFMPPGKVADFFGFQYMRDVDIAGHGHNTTFLTKAAANVLSILDEGQVAKLVALAKEQAPLYVDFAYNRFPLFEAFRRNLEGDLPKGAAGLDVAAVADYTANLYRLDAQLSYERAMTVGDIVASFTPAQRSYLAAMAFDDSSTWPAVQEDADLKRSMTNTEFVAVMTYASELFSWYKGSLEADVYFCPERHGTYFGGFFMKDYPAMNDPDYFISTSLTGDSGQRFLEILNVEQRTLIIGIIEEQRDALREIAEIRTAVCTELRKALSGGTVDKERVFTLVQRYGALDGQISALYATRFAAVNKTLTAAQRAALVKLRNLDVVPDNAYLFSTPVGAPEIGDTSFLFGVGVAPEDAGQRRAPTGFAPSGPGPAGSLPTGPAVASVPGDQLASVILGRPTASTMTASVLPTLAGSAYLEWGDARGTYGYRTAAVNCSTTEPAVLLMDGLEPNRQYYYRLRFRAVGAGAYAAGAECSFQTPRSGGAEFSFVVQTDSHLLNKADPNLYSRSLRTMAALRPDMMFDLGDTFLNEQGDQAPSRTYDQIAATYRQQLPYLSIVARSAPLFLTIGNHEGEYGGLLDGSPGNIAVSSTLARTTYYPNPLPNGFYSGNTDEEPDSGAPQNYYAFTWGDALFVSIDPYRYSQVSPFAADGKESWDFTLGKAQYDWFRQTLETSNAKYKFVFAHHVNGLGRGGSELASLYEWGGYDRSGRYVFDEQRPGWGKPIHQVMSDAGVTVFFQGHDHLFAREVVDGVVYQTLPKPAEVAADRQTNFDAYQGADVLLNSGFLNVTITAAGVQVDYHRTYFVSSEPQAGNTGVVYSYIVDPVGQVRVLKQVRDSLALYGSASETATPVSAVATTQPKGLTQVPAGGYAFTVTADSHLDANTDPAAYRSTLTTIAAERPSLHIDLGDTFMAEKFARTKAEIEPLYTRQAGFLSELGAIPVYLVNGNHDGESGWDTAGGVDIEAWAREMRLKYFPLPAGSANLSGDTTAANYYAFTQGPALFVALDPFSFTAVKPRTAEEGWNYTLGKTQYDWLKRTLETSTAPLKFVFIHNLVGGGNKDARGGVEAAGLFEWGGRSLDGQYDFDQMRPGWGEPIHSLLVANGVTAVFHGHDHFYARQELDGIAYLLVPQPGSDGRAVMNAPDYGYASGTFLPGAGHLRVIVWPDGRAIAEYVTVNLTGAGSTVADRLAGLGGEVR